jgi:beta-galactosidase
MLDTPNFGDKPIEHLTKIAAAYNMPLYVSEYWTAWFAQWGDKHVTTKNLSTYENDLEDIMFTMNSSINIYLFCTGTNFGFMAGGTEVLKNGGYTSVTTRHEYDSPITDSGMFST